MSWFRDSTVSVIRERPGYPRMPPYSPSEVFPEWQGLARGGEDNPAFRAVRLALFHLGLDAGRFGSPDWNPVGELVEPGETVVVKPNFVSHRNLGESAKGIGATDCLVTHGSVVRAVVDYAAKGLRGRGRIIVGDCPIQGTRWPALVSLVGLDAIMDDAARRYPGIAFSCRDYRLTHATGRVLFTRRSVEPDAEQYREIDLGRDSLLLPLMKGGVDFGVAQYGSGRMKRAHTPDTNRYIIPRDFLDADLFINLPKMKSHQKAGITCALKNLVGVNGHKDYLPHFRVGSPKQGGDEHPDGNAVWRLYWSLVHADWEMDRGPRKLAWWAGSFACGQILRRILRVPRSAFAQGSGSWHGNDTLWRTVLDVNRAFLYYHRASGALGAEPSRRYLCLLDGLIGGDRESPLAPSPVAAGLVLASRNPLAMDTVAAALMGLDWRKLPQIQQAYALRRYPLADFRPEDISIRGCPGLEGVEDVYVQPGFARFEPSCGWKGRVERDAAATPLPESRSA